MKKILTNTEVAYLRLPTDMMRLFRREARDLNLTPSTYIRLMLQRAMKLYDNDLLLPKARYESYGA